MLVVLIIITVASLLTVTLLSQGEHLDSATFRDRKWHTALQVAESGVDRTIARLNANYSFAGFSTAQTAPGGQFETFVANGDSLGLGLGRRSITSTAYIPSKGHDKEVRRRVRVVLGPPPALKYAVFGDKCVTVDNAGSLTGDVFSNGHVIIQNSTVVRGDVTSSRGAVKLNPLSEVQKNGPFGGTVRSGGKASATDLGCPAVSTSGRHWGVQLDNNSTVHGDVRAQRPECGTSPPNSEYGISGGNGSKVLGNAVAWGLIDVAVTVSPGVRQQPECELRAAPVALPKYAAYDPVSGYNVSFYTTVAPATTVTEYSTVAAFKAYMDSAKTNLRGIHLIDPSAADSGTAIDMSGTTIKDHFVLATPGLIYRGNSSTAPFFDDLADPKKTVQLISLAAPGTTGIEFDDNFFEIKGLPCLLMYSTATIVMKNKATIHGALYGDKVEVKNNLDLKYDKCVESSLAFGDELAEVRNFFNELPSS